MSDYAIDLLRDLISIDSVNPSLAEDGRGEAEIAGAVADEMRRIGLDREVTEAAPGRPNVVGVLEGARPGPSLMLCGHLDTVGVAGMSAPFNPIESDGRIFGRGAQDMKGGLASILGAARLLAENGGLQAGRLIVAGVADEEYASIGAEALVTRWKADAAVITEPTDMVVAVAHKGFSWVEVVTRGRAAHGSRPKEGCDAILRMGRVMQCLESLNQKLMSGPGNSTLGSPSLHASLVSGGREMSTYPDRCELKLERRTITGEPDGIALREVETILEQLRAEDPEFEASARLLFSRTPYQIVPDSSLPGKLEESIRGIGRHSSRAGMTFWTDAAVLGEAGIPTVVFGPGGAGLHGLEEYVLRDDVIDCQNALVALARDFCCGQN